jgi:hypothetical protein
VVKKRPDQIGNERSPRSNSIQTVAPSSGKALPVFLEEPFVGKQGSAQPSASAPPISGAATRIRPSPFGSTVSITVARYFPKYFALTLIVAEKDFENPRLFLPAK